MAVDMKKYEVSPDKLCSQCDPSMFEFECTGDLAPLGEFIGQDRAIKAIEFGLSMQRDGYNIYVAGLAGTGKTTVVKSYIKKLIEKRKAEDAHLEDWCYLYNTGDPDRPQIMNLAQGKGKVFRDHIASLQQALKEELTKAFSSEEYKAQRKKTVEENTAAQQKLFQQLEEEARQQSFMLQVTALGPALVAVHNGKPLSDADFMALKETDQKKLEAKRDGLLKKLQATVEKARELAAGTAEKLLKTDKAIADYTVSRLFRVLMEEYKDNPRITQYLNDLKSYTLNNLDAFKESEEAQQTVMGMPAAYLTRGRDPFLPFQVNVFVDNSATVGPPVIIETNPNYSNLFGKTERRFLLGGYLSDHTMLKAGAVQLANGGYLLLSANDVLLNPGVWPTLKRVIKNKEVRIEDPFEQFGLIAPQGLKPQPMPIEVKIVLIGETYLYQMLAMYDEDFWEIFKVKADFDYQVDRSKENMKAFAAFISGCCEDCEIRHFDRTGAARIVEYASRMVADQEKMSTRFAQLKELIEESGYWAGQDGSEFVSGKHVLNAIEQRRYRHNLPDERINELIKRGTIMIDTQGAVVGQVNALSVYELGDISFGKPSRITCKTFMGRGGVINIERESQLSGRIHDKGVLILSGYLGWKYAQDNPLSLSASLCFEQSYEGVEGDSASSTELYALLSSLSDVPIKQNIAVTGSVNQKGEIQPIGGVNQKIEGFFQVCRAKELTGEQGVMIPFTNLKNLMLREEVVNAVKQGKFHIYAVSTIDEGIEVLTGVEAGRRTKDGYPESTINFLVDKKMKDNAARLRQFYSPAEEEKKDGQKKEAVVKTGR